MSGSEGWREVCVGDAQRREPGGEDRVRPDEARGEVEGPAGQNQVSAITTVAVQWLD